MPLLCLAAAFLALLLCWALTPAIRGLALQAGFLDRPGQHKTHQTPIPYGGGLAVLLAVAATLSAGAWVWSRLLPHPALLEWREFLELGTPPLDPRLLRLLGLILGGSGGALLLGLADDRWTLSPLAKLLGQLVLAMAMVAGGIRITALVGDTLFMQICSVFWIVLVTNSFNLLDNMDGLCCGTAAISAGVLGIVAASAGQPSVALLCATVSGACLGFLWWNRAPARIYLGDAGSLFLGFLLACLTVVTTYYHYEGSQLSVGVPLLVLAIPLYDTASVIVIRIREHRRIWKGDNSHFSHRLVDLGMSRRQAVSTIHLAALAIALPATVIGRLSTGEGLILTAQSLLILTLIALLEHAGRLRAR